MKKKKIVRIIVIAAVAALVGAMFLYLATGNHAASDVAKQAMQSTDKVTVEETGGEIAFVPTENPTKTGLVFYPGGKVDADAYAPLAHGVADGSVLCVIVKMPFDLAVFNSGGAANVLGEYPEIENWYISGHSLGGVMAADYAAKDERIKGVAFLAAYPNTDLSKSALRGLSLTASEDQVLNRQKYQEALPTFPANTVFQEIEGGNHSGFGSYQRQQGDGEALISGEEQNKQTTQNVLEWMNG